MSTPKIYLAGKFHDEQMPSRMADLIKLGFSITHDWTVNKDVPMVEAAVLDINGVKECNTLIAVMDDENYSYRGTFTEIGCAIGLGKRIIIVNPNKNADCVSNCFYHHPRIEYCTSLMDACNLVQK